jgi:hypothetical protein
MRDILILNDIWAKYKIYNLVDILLGKKLALFCHLNFTKVYIGIRYS